MPDPLAWLLGVEATREWIAIFAWLLAPLIGFLAILVTPDAGWRCYYAFMRLVHRYALAFLSIALFYYGTVILVTDHGQPGAALLVMLLMFVTTLISAMRHLPAPAIPADMTWRGFFSQRRLLHKIEPSPSAASSNAQ